MLPKVSVMPDDFRVYQRFKTPDDLVLQKVDETTDDLAFTSLRLCP